MNDEWPHAQQGLLGCAVCMRASKQTWGRGGQEFGGHRQAHGDALGQSTGGSACRENQIAFNAGCQAVFSDGTLNMRHKIV